MEEIEYVLLDNYEESKDIIIVQRDATADDVAGDIGLAAIGDGSQNEGRNKALDVTKICRTCLEEKPVLQSLFDDINRETVTHMLVSFAAIKLQDGDGMPGHICNQCINLVEQSFLFKQQCERSESILRNIICQEDDQLIADIEMGKFDALQFNDNTDDLSQDNKCYNEKPLNSVNESIHDDSDDSSKKGINNGYKPEIVSVKYEEALYEKDLDNQRNLHEDTEELACAVCLKIFLDKHRLLRHIKIHMNEKQSCQANNNFADSRNLERQLLRHQKKAALNFPYPCTKCHHGFSSERDLYIHSAIHSVDDKHLCYQCNKEFSNKRRLSRHIKIHMNEKQRCHICNNNFADSRNLERHMLKHQNKAALNFPYPCTKCHRGFSSERDLYVHSAIHSVNDKHLCNQCNKEFSTATKLRRHVSTHLLDKPHKCDICHKGFAEKYSLRRHIRTHSGEPVVKNHVCSSCGKAYAFTHQLRVHIRNHTGERPCICAVCGKRFSDLRLLNSHMRLHSDNKPHACPHCDKKFRHEQTLVCHLRVHTGEKPYNCDLCGMRFKQSSNLAIHLRRHRGERPYTCNVCDKKFTSSSALVIHTRIHTGVKPYVCDICGKAFTRCNLNAHIRTHTGERPFACTRCNRKFTTQSQLNKHSKMHTKVKPYTCNICGRGWLLPNHLKKHLETNQVCSKQKAAQAEQNPKEKNNEVENIPMIIDLKEQIKDTQNMTETNLVPININSMDIKDLVMQKVTFVKTDSAMHYKDDMANEHYMDVAQVISVENVSEGTLNIVTVTQENGEILASHCPFEPTTEEHPDLYHINNGILPVSKSDMN